MEVAGEARRHADEQVACIASRGLKLPRAVFMMSHFAIPFVEAPGIIEAAQVGLSHAAGLVCAQAPLSVAPGQLEKTAKEELHDAELARLLGSPLQPKSM